MKWHQALAYAVVGRRFPELGEQDRPDVDILAAWLVARAGAGSLPASSPVASPVPADLAVGLGPAQFQAALTELRHRLQPRSVAPVLIDRPLTPEERRLLADAPPHHA